MIDFKLRNQKILRLNLQLINCLNRKINIFNVLKMHKVE